MKNTKSNNGMLPKVRGKIGLVLKGYPRLSETFIAQEILELERAGFDIDIISLRHPYDGANHPIHGEISAKVHYLPEYLHDEPLRVFKAWMKVRKLPGYWKAWKAFWKDFRRERTRNRVRRFGQALVMAAEYSPLVSMYYVHFLHTPASATRYASIIAGQAFAISAHAKDIWTSPDWEISEKMADCEWLTTCTKGGADHIEALAPEKGKVHLIYHGLDLSRFPSPSTKNNTKIGSPIRLITVGRAVAKKGIDTILSALARLPNSLNWHWTHIGGGELRDELIEQAEALGITDRCTFLGALPQKDVIEAYRSSDIFVLPCRITASGDRDGLPNVIVEAQSQRLPVISTPISGIPELIEDDVNGVFVQPDDVDALSGAIANLADDQKKRTRLGRAGEKKVRGGFDHKVTISDLVELLDETLEQT